jgi:hypothetical protein
MSPEYTTLNTPGSSRWKSLTAVQSTRSPPPPALLSSVPSAAHPRTESTLGVPVRVEETNKLARSWRVTQAGEQRGARALLPRVQPASVQMAKADKKSGVEKS